MPQPGRKNSNKVDAAISKSLTSRVCALLKPIEDAAVPVLRTLPSRSCTCQTAPRHLSWFGQYQQYRSMAEAVSQSQIFRRLLGVWNSAYPNSLASARYIERGTAAEDRATASALRAHRDTRPVPPFGDICTQIRVTTTVAITTRKKKHDGNAGADRAAGEVGASRGVKRSQYEGSPALVTESRG